MAQGGRRLLEQGWHWMSIFQNRQNRLLVLNLEIMIVEVQLFYTKSQALEKQKSSSRIHSELGDIEYLCRHTILCKSTGWCDKKFCHLWKWSSTVNLLVGGTTEKPCIFDTAHDPHPPQLVKGIRTGQMESLGNVGLPQQKGIG